MAKSKKSYKIAQEYYLAKEYEQAFNYYKQHISTNPREYGHIYHEFVETCKYLDIDVAEVYEDVLAVAPTEENFLELYTSLMSSGRFEDAFKTLKRVFAIETTEELNYISYGMEFYNNGYYTYAIEIYNEAITKTNDSETIEFFNSKIEEASKKNEDVTTFSTDEVSEEECETISFLLEYNNVKEIKKKVEQNNHVLHCRDRMGRTLLMYAATNIRHLEIVKYLINKGADINAQDKKNLQPIHFSAQHKDLSMVKLLLENGVNINVQDGNGGTVLHQFIYDEKAKNYLISKVQIYILKIFMTYLLKIC